MLKKPFHRFIHPDQQAGYFQVRRQLFETGQPLSLDLQLLKKDGSHFWAHLETTLRPDALERSEKDAEPTSAWIVISAIGERKRMEQALRESHEQLVFQNDEKAKRAAELEIANRELTFQNDEKAKRAAELALVNAYLENLIDYANAPIIVWDSQFRITRFNHAFEFLTGHTEAEVRGQSLEILFPATLIEKSMAQIQATLVGERWESVEIKILHRDTSIRTVLWNSATLFEPDGKTALATIAQGQDITLRKLAEQALQTANNVLELRVLERTADLQESNAALKVASKSKDDFLAIISHELRTPLTGILGLSQALQMNLNDELKPKQAIAVQNIEKNGQHLLDLINQILDFSSIQAGKFILLPETCSLDHICQASMQLVNVLALKKEQNISFVSLPKNITLQADQLRLRQVIVNLLSNAIKFTPAGGSIELRVTAQPDSHQVLILVSDSGIGIKAEDLPHLFEPFVQVDMSRSRKYKGTGLGLAIVKQIVELHAGSVSVSSDFGHGSRFTVSLPCENPS